VRSPRGLDYASLVQLVEFGALSVREWIDLTGREREPFGARSAGLVWGPKERHVGLREPGGRLAAVAGAMGVTVEVDGVGPFDVVGLGGLIIRKDLRGQGLMPALMDGLAGLAESMGPDRAMIFCDTHLIALYQRRGYRLISDPVWVDQPEGRVEMPVSALWRPLRPGPVWPPGRVDVRALPF
jgi:GNAT superfamily N-acetyltransferase